MTHLRRATIALFSGVLLVALAACGGGSSSNSNSTTGGGSSTTANSVSVSLNQGPSTAYRYTNGIFASVTVCQPGTSSCQTVDNVLVDTGSTGLRLLSGALTGIHLTNVTSGGTTLTNCATYLDNSYNWGPVATADVKLGGEVASSVPIQIIEEPTDTFAAAPASCGGTPANTVDSLLANGILGISFYQQDCGSGCAPGTPANSGDYYACGSTACSVTTASLSQQLQNPIGLFSTDNNGLVLTLPTIASAGVVSATGTLTFGVGTQSDNTPGSTVAMIPDAYGLFSTTFNSITTNNAFIDSGSSAFFFLDSTSTGLPGCATYTGMYCPSSTESFTATNRGSDGTTSSVPFSVADADTLLNSSNNVFSDLAGEGTDTAVSPTFTYFDWGLPFFFGRNVYIVLENKSAGSKSGPYWAY